MKKAIAIVIVLTLAIIPFTSTYAASENTSIADTISSLDSKLFEKIAGPVIEVFAKIITIMLAMLLEPDGNPIIIE